MEKTDKQKFFPLMAVAVFVLCVVVSALLANIIITGNVYIPAVPELGTLSFTETLLYITDCLSSSVTQLGILFISGYSSLSVYASAAVCGYRGVSFGYTAALIAGSSLKFHSDSVSILPFLKLPTAAAVLTLYLFSTAAVAAASYCAVKRSALYICSAHAGRKYERRYICTFLIISGAVFLCDTVKLLLLCNR